MTLRKGLLGLALAIGTLAPMAASAEVIYLGEYYLTRGDAHDTIEVGADKGKLTALQVRVQQSAAQIDRVVVHFAGGRSVERSIQKRIPEGSETREIALPMEGGAAIDRIEVFYGEAPKNPAHLKFYGRTS